MHSHFQQPCKFIDRNKKKCLYKKRVELSQDWFGTPTWLLFHCFRTPIWLPWCQVHTLYNYTIQWTAGATAEGVHLRESMLKCLCSVIDHRWRQNTVRTKTCGSPMLLPHFDIFCGLLLNTPMAIWNLLVLCNEETRKLQCSWYHLCVPSNRS